MFTKKNELVKERAVLLSIALIIIAGFIVYGNSIGGKFIWDDNFLIKNNAYIKDLSEIVRFFTENIGAGAGKNYNFYRPVQLLSYAIDYSIFGLNTKGYHFTNILLHILMALSVYWIVNILYKDRLLSVFTGVLFVVHPINTEAVSYIAGRADILTGLFCLLSFICYIRYLRVGSTRLYIFMLLTYICAILSKENSLILPILFLFYHYAFKEKAKIKSFLPILGITFAYILLRLTVLKFQMPASASTDTLTQRIPNFFAVIATYVRLLFLPLHLHMEYLYAGFSFSDAVTLSGMLILILSILYAFRKRNSDGLIFFSIGWFFITLLPHSNLYPINAYMAEHWLYIPSIGFFVIMARGLSFLYRKKSFYIIPIIGLLIFYSDLTIRQNKYWREPISFYERTLRYAPYSSRVYYNLGNEYDNIGKKEKAIEAYKKAIEINPNYADAYFNLGNIYRDIGKKEEAISSYKKVIDLNPNDASLYNNIGVVYGSMGRNEDAIVLFKKAAVIDPRHAKAYCNIGIVYRSIGRDEEAIALFKKAIAIDPRCVEAHYNLASLYYSKNRYDLAIEHCDKVVKLGFVDPVLLKNLETYRKKH